MGEAELIALIELEDNGSGRGQTALAVAAGILIVRHDADSRIEVMVTDRSGQARGLCGKELFRHRKGIGIHNDAARGGRGLDRDPAAVLTDCVKRMLFFCHQLMQRKRCCLIAVEVIPDAGLCIALLPEIVHNTADRFAVGGFELCGYTVLHLREHLDRIVIYAVQRNDRMQTVGMGKCGHLRAIDGCVSFSDVYTAGCLDHITDLVIRSERDFSACQIGAVIHVGVGLSAVFICDEIRSADSADRDRLCVLLALQQCHAGDREERNTVCFFGIIIPCHGDLVSRGCIIILHEVCRNVRRLAAGRYQVIHNRERDDTAVFVFVAGIVDEQLGAEVIACCIHSLRELFDMRGESQTGAVDRHGACFYAGAALKTDCSGFTGDAGEEGHFHTAGIFIRDLIVDRNGLREGAAADTIGINIQQFILDDRIDIAFLALGIRGRLADGMLHNIVIDLRHIRIICAELSVLCQSFLRKRGLMRNIHNAGCGFGFSVIVLGECILKAFHRDRIEHNGIRAGGFKSDCKGLCCCITVALCKGGKGVDFTFKAHDLHAEDLDFRCEFDVSAKLHGERLRDAVSVRFGFFKSCRGACIIRIHCGKILEIRRCGQDSQDFRIGILIPMSARVGHIAGILIGIQDHIHDRLIAIHAALTVSVIIEEGMRRHLRLPVVAVLDIAGSICAHSIGAAVVIDDVLIERGLCDCVRHFGFLIRIAEFLRTLRRDRLLIAVQDRSLEIIAVRIHKLRVQPVDVIAAISLLAEIRIAGFDQQSFLFRDRRAGLDFDFSLTAAIVYP